VDFFYGHRSHALKFLEFLGSMVPMKNRSDKQLVSFNEQNAVYNYKYTFSVQIVPICKEDLCLLPLKVSSQRSPNIHLMFTECSLIERFSIRKCSKAKSIPVRSVTQHSLNVQ
jgi:NMD protein affecting ribosome stability and mRNA decay